MKNIKWKGLKRFLEKNGLKQSDFARMLGVTRQSVNNWLITDKKPNIITYKKMLEVIRENNFIFDEEDFLKF
jgi:DNA-binding transcriptional regulator YiaG